MTQTSTSGEAQELGQFIPLHYHYQMLLDQARVLGFEKAISSLVPQGGKVLELGGGTGILSFYASKKASKVWCVEQNSEMARAARGYLELNGCKNVEVIEQDAASFLPPEPVDVVICEMLHSGLLREKQTQVLSSFQKRYQEKFGSLPIFIPEATFLGVQLVHQAFTFNGYYAPIPMSLPAGMEHTSTVELGSPYVYSNFEYKKPLPQHFVCSTELPVERDGELNALRFVTKNVLAVLLEEETSIDWHNFYLIVPIPKPLSVTKGQRVKVTFSYPAGGKLQDLISSLQAKIA